MQVYKAVVIGAGQMGAGIDDKLVSHAAAFKNNPRCQLLAIFDPSVENLEKAASHWEVEGYSDMESMLRDKQPDIVSICSPDFMHATQMELVAEYSPKAIIVEKPVALNLNDLSKIEHFFSKRNTIVAVNYTRRYLSAYYYLKEAFSSQALRAVSIRYAKGLKHNGTHAIDLIRFLFGEIRAYKILSSANDYKIDDPTVSIYFETDSCANIVLQGLNQNDYVFFEVDVFTDQNRYTIHSDHQILSVYCVSENQGTPLGKRLVFEKDIVIEHHKGTNHLVENVLKALDNKAARFLNLEEALRSERLALKISEELSLIPTIEEGI
ncbi:Gfo/Idh/MocA family oxidoreductase [Candidatus Berkiella cookevillensis]|uniref:Gfo/Idh/MocA family oxidoreductase n=1 Tax=Candidatus Berkiella cookevillensis TaxID=437022 RepID=A0A0Q9YPS3_9GAMM|nr:Gfo/Idh/MocA family oxidoreductase [Candidatus Berkiella cookevillensis]MCS5707695.1 Gfo/Idh/MocA family oxidoreductase [Candidatus Berkiella cookevillensis]